MDICHKVNEANNIHYSCHKLRLSTHVIIVHIIGDVHYRHDIHYRCDPGCSYTTHHCFATHHYMSHTHKSRPETTNHPQPDPPRPSDRGTNYCFPPIRVGLAVL